MAADQPAEPESRVSREPERESVRFGMRTRSVMGAILVLAFALRAIKAVRTSVMFEDGPHFLGVAKLFASGDWAGALSHPYHPLYSAFSAVVERLVHDWEVAALSVSVIAGTAAVLALYLFLREAFDPPSAIFGAFLLAISPYGFASLRISKARESIWRSSWPGLRCCFGDSRAGNFGSSSPPGCPPVLPISLGPRARAWFWSAWGCWSQELMATAGEPAVCWAPVRRSPAGRSSWLLPTWEC